MTTGVLGLRLLLLGLAVAGCSAATDKGEASSVDLNTMKSHERDLSLNAPDFELEEAIEQHRARMRQCQETMGQGAEPDGLGGCQCGFDFTLQDGACKAPPAAIKNAERLDVRIPGLPLCFSVQDCTDRVRESFKSVRSDQAICSAREGSLDNEMATMNSTLDADLVKRQAHTEEIREWILELRRQNQAMVGELKKYSVQSKENNKLTGDMNKMKEEKYKLEKEVARMKIDLENLKVQGNELQNKLNSDHDMCSEAVTILKKSLEEQGIALPQLEG